MKDVVKTSIVVPCYKSKATLDGLVGQLLSVMQAREGGFEIILVNDASPDDTWGAIERLAAQHPEVVGVDLQYNVGQFKATLCGMEQAVGRVVATLDDDLQHPPKELPKLLDRLDANQAIDCVIGAYAKKQHGFVRRLGTLWYGKLSEHLYGKPQHLEMTSFRAMRRNLVQAMLEYRTTKPFLETLILKCTSPRRVLNVEVEHHPRRIGRSGYNYRRLARIVFDNVVSNTALPFHAIATVGIACLLAGIPAGMVWLIGALMGASFATGLFALGAGLTTAVGMMLAAVGVCGEYLHRVVLEMTGPPRYVLRQRVSARRPIASTQADLPEAAFADPLQLESPIASPLTANEGWSANVLDPS